MAERQPGPSACALQELEDAKSSPAFFTCASGELLWGQVHTVIAGSASSGVDSELGPQQESDGSASAFRYRVAARKGQWKVEAAYQDGAEGEPWHVGFVCHHVDVDGAEVLRRRQGSVEPGGSDLRIVFVDRYDWSGSRSPGCELVVQAVEGKEVDADEEFEDEPYYRSLVYGRFMLVDALGFPNLVQALKDRTRIEQRNYVMRKKNDSGSSCSDSEEKSSFGVHLVVDDSEYDMGWMVFQNEDLVGFVYDGAYSALEGDNLRIGKN